MKLIFGVDFASATLLVLTGFFGGKLLEFFYICCLGTEIVLFFPIWMPFISFLFLA